MDENIISVLKEQIEALEKLLVLRQAIINEQDRRINQLETEKYNFSYTFLGPTANTYSLAPISVPVDVTLDSSKLESSNQKDK